MEGIAQSQMLMGLIVGITLLIFMILKTKVHVFPALIIAAIVTGTIGGMPSAALLGAIKSGFGGTLGSIGIIIGFGVMMGAIFELSGAAKTMARTFVKILGKGREDYALAITGFLVSIPIFCDSAFVVLSPIVKAISRNTKKSIVGFGVTLAVALVITHSLVPPTPGPVGVAGIFGVSVGSVLLWGIVISIPMVIVGMIYAKKVGNELFQLPAPQGEGFTRDLNDYNSFLEESEDEEKLPSAFASFLPILLPVVLILMDTTIKAMGVKGAVSSIFGILGDPIVAVGLGLLVAIYGLALKNTRDEVIASMEASVKQAGIILLVTGGGGALGTVLRTSGIGNYVAEGIIGLSLPGIIVPIAVSTLVRLVQGSGTVAMITAASITAPMTAALGVDPVFMAMGCMVGSLIFSYFNDSYFWVVNRTLGITEVKEQIKIWSVTTTICWAVGSITVIILNMIFG